jgi:hypothetical protein
MKALILKSKITIPVLVGLLFFSTNALAQKERLQTAFIYQLTRLIEWCPDGKEGNFVIGVVGNAPELATELAALQTRRVGTQQIEIKNFASINDITTCNILFVPESIFGSIKDISSKVSKHCTLIISDRSGAALQGAGITLTYVEKVSKIEFEINRSYMNRNSLNVNSQLFTLATSVY